MSRGSIFLFITITIFMSSCAMESVYHPNTFYVPNHTKKNEWAVQSNLRYFGGDFQTSYSLSNHFAAYGGSFLRTQPDSMSGNSKRHSASQSYTRLDAQRYIFGEAGIMYFDTFNTYIHLNLMTGYGGGSAVAIDGYNKRSSVFNRFFMQADVGYTNDYFQAGVVGRLTAFNLAAFSGKEFNDYQKPQFNIISPFIETGFYLKAGYDPVYLFTQTMYTLPLDKNNVMYYGLSPYFFPPVFRGLSVVTIGVGYKIDLPETPSFITDEFPIEKKVKMKKQKKKSKKSRKQHD